MKFVELTKHYGLEENTLDFLGHAVALYTDNSYVNRPALEVINKIQLYIDSAGKFGDSHFIYPVYGLSGIPESFSRKSAVYGGTYMLNVTLKNITKIDDGYEIKGVWEGVEG
jgi:Rab GDP dissociation inhibitor